MGRRRAGLGRDMNAEINTSRRTEARGGYTAGLLMTTPEIRAARR